jgi:PIN domain nuclease of toxin-antitoxin system
LNVLLDTCTFVWLTNGDPGKRLPRSVFSTLQRNETKLFLSSISHWELTQLIKAGRAGLAESFMEKIASARRALAIESLPFGESDAAQLIKLPEIHCDPFDRMLICQAINNGLMLCTPDRFIRRYPIRTFWNEVGNE